MKVYQIQVELNEYQTLNPIDVDHYLEFSRLYFKKFNCKSIMDYWQNKDFYILEPLLEKSNFPGSMLGSIMLDEKAAKSLTEFWEYSGEIVPIICNNSRYYIFHCLKCYDYLDDKNTKWKIRNDKKIRILDFAFFENRFQETPIFTIPQMSTRLFTVVDKNFEFNLLEQIEKNKLVGLRFKEIWSNE